MIVIAFLVLVNVVVVVACVSIVVGQRRALADASESETERPVLTSEEPT